MLELDLTKPTLKEAIKQEGIIPLYTSMAREHVELFIAMHMLEGEDVPEVLEEPLVKIMKNKLSLIEKENVITEKAYVGLLSLGIDNPGKAVVTVIDVLNYLDKKDKERFEFDDIVNLYPMGTYEQETFIEIVDKIMKPKKCRYSELY